MPHHNKALSAARKVKTLFRRPAPAHTAHAAHDQDQSLTAASGRLGKVDSLRLTQQRSRRHEEVATPLEDDTPSANAQRPLSSRSVTTGERLRVTFNPKVVSVSAEDRRRFYTAPLCTSGKDTRSRLRSLTHAEKSQLYRTRKDLMPEGFSMPPAPIPPQGRIVAPRFASQKPKSPHPAWAASDKPLRDSLERRKPTTFDGACFDGNKVRDSLAALDDSDEEDYFVSRVSLDSSAVVMQRMRSSSMDLSDDAFIDWPSAMVGYV